MTSTPRPSSFPILLVSTVLAALSPVGVTADETTGLALNELEYLAMPGLNVMLAHDFYPEGHQGGVSIIQNGLRVGTNGDLRLDRTPGQWQPVPKVGERVIDRATQEISIRMEYPDPEKDRKGFNPVIYPDLQFAYTIRVRPEGQAFRILVDLEKPLPDEWIGKVGFNFELFPGVLFGKTWATENGHRSLPPPGERPREDGRRDEYGIEAMATGTWLAIAPESDRQRLRIEDATGGGAGADRRPRPAHQRLVRGPLPGRRAAPPPGAVNWLVTPHAIPGWISDPVVQVSQVGYHTAQQKRAVIELDATDERRPPVDRLPGGRGRNAGDRPRRAGGGVGPLPPLRLPALRLQRGPDARHVRGALRRRAVQPLPHRRRRLRPRGVAAHGRVLPPGPDVPRAGERPLPGVARRLPPRRRAHGAGGPHPLRRVRPGPGDPDLVRRPASTSPASTAGAGTTPGTTTCGSSPRRTRCTGSPWPGRRFGPTSTTPPSTRSSASSSCTGPTGSPTSSSRSSTGP